MITHLSRALRSATGRQWRAVRSGSLTIAGLGLLVAAAFMFCVAAGLVAAGIGLLLLEWLTADE